MSYVQGFIKEKSTGDFNYRVTDVSVLQFLRGQQFNFSENGVFKIIKICFYKRTV